MTPRATLLALASLTLSCASTVSPSPVADVPPIIDVTPPHDITVGDASPDAPPPPLVIAGERLTARSSHTCLRASATRGWCWGSNFYGELGLAPPDGPGRDRRAVLIEDRALSGALTLASNGSTAMLAPTGEVWTRGADITASTPRPTVRTEWERLAGWERPSRLFNSGYFLCALDEGAVSCVGFDSGGWIFGERGREQRLRVPTRVDRLARVVHASISSEHLCAARDDGGVWCVGRNDEGACGEPSSQFSALHRVEGVPPASRVEVAGLTSCALTREGEVWCWGRNYDGQLGDGTTQPNPTPRRVEGLAGVTDLALSFASACAVAKGDVYCWGWPVGPWGPGGTHSGSRPARVEGLANVVEAALGASHACALTGDGEVWCWGGREFGQLGDGVDDYNNFTAQRTPVRALLPRTE